jgi:hypothetical protein
VLTDRMQNRRQRGLAAAVSRQRYDVGLRHAQLSLANASGLQQLVDILTAKRRSMAG